MAKFDPLTPLKPADVQRLQGLLHAGAKSTAIKLYAGLRSCSLSQAEQSLAALEAQWAENTGPDASSSGG